MYKITRRPATVEDFVANKDYKPWKPWRKKAKPVNFGAIFGCSGPALGSQCRKDFSEADLDEMLETFGLTEEYNKSLMEQKLLPRDRQQAPIDIKFNIIGTQLRTLFFDGYPCLLERTLREQDYAIQHYDVQSIAGPRRLLGLLQYIDVDPVTKKPRGTDYKMFSKTTRSLLNDATNSPIQTAEVYQAMPNVTALMNAVDIANLKSYTFNEVHDSQELYIHKTESGLMYGYLHELASVARNPYFGLPMHIDVCETDVDKGEVLGSGKDIDTDEVDFKEELKKYNEAMGTNITYEQVDPKQWIPIYDDVPSEKYVGKQYTKKRKGGRSDID